MLIHMVLIDLGLTDEMFDCRDAIDWELEELRRKARD